MLYSYTAVNPCNEIYVFDRELYMEFHNAGIQTVRYMPMAANVERLDRITTAVSAADSADVPSVPAAGATDFLYDISFVGHSTQNSIISMTE